ncbi:hypothetical protein A1A1_13377 [Planococcus antarcticus DSM 14505]|uniref:Uncharacterized protein n=1 Tax=Planococcus antarcticus DSM 14505 TaxID=1185653 RepID=A0A1C7DHE1_9BACL|nr:hypothetical protein [Planococcus antarcticus]ANU10832.1 hypothetical protein BBH88_11175 [Planococcus antarcticus DSM 14505]EIM05998.1 hypothetical protein A1A1_13377 [Planococcus antarcticus DSM 14505]
MEQKLAVTNDIVFFAFKYALGSRSDIPVLVIDTIKENINRIKDFDLRKYIREIYEYRNSGMMTDETTWLDFADYLQEELRSRE